MLDLKQEVSAPRPFPINRSAHVVMVNLEVLENQLKLREVEGKGEDGHTYPNIRCAVKLDGVLREVRAQPWASGEWDVLHPMRAVSTLYSCSARTTEANPNVVMVELLFVSRRRLTRKPRRSGT